MPKPVTSGAYLLIGSGLTTLPEIRGPYPTQETAAADADRMSAQPNIIVVGPLPVASIVQGAL